jgi:hypothetical protein
MFRPRIPCQPSIRRNCPRKDFPRNCNSTVMAGAVLFVPSNATSSYCLVSGDVSAATYERGSRDTSAPVSSNIGTSPISMPSCSDLTVTCASGAGGSNRAASYSCIVRPSNIHHKIGGIFRMRQLRRTKFHCGRHKAGSCALFHTQMNASPLGQRERLKGAKRALGEDGIDLADHEVILINRCRTVEPLSSPIAKP